MSVIYFSRDSLCAGIDGYGVHIAKYEIDDAKDLSAAHVFDMIKRYLGHALPDYYWRSYINGSKFADISVSCHDNRYSFEASLSDNWKQLLENDANAYFLAVPLNDTNKLPDELDKGFLSFEDVSEIYEKYVLHI